MTPGEQLVRRFPAADGLRAVGRGLASTILPGLGQALAGRFPRAVAVAFGAAAVGAAAVWSLLAVPTVLGVVLPLALLLGIRLWAAADAARLTGTGPPSSSGVKRAGELSVFLVFAVALEVLAGRVRHRLVGESFYLAAASMEPTLRPGDYVMTVPVQRQPVLRGDVIAFIWPEDRTRRFAKRVVGVPGDTLAMHWGVLVVNGRPVAEPYARRSTMSAPQAGDELEWQRDHVPPGAATVGYHPTRDTWGPLIVPQRAYFVLGDNREQSLDSRYWGFVPDSLLLSYPRRVYFSFDPERRRVRWSRIGLVIASP